MLRNVATTLLIALASGFACNVHAAQQPAAQDAEPANFHALLDEQMMRVIRVDPELRSLLGISGDGIDLSDRLTDVSLPRREQLRAQIQANLAEVRAWDDKDLAGQQRLSHDMAAWFYERQIELMRFDWSPAWLPAGATTYAVDQLFSIPVTLPQFMENSHPVRDAHDAANYIARLRAIATKLDQVRDNLDMQVRLGATPPQVALEGAADQMRALVGLEPAQSPFVLSFARKLERVDGIDADARKDLLAQAATAVREATNPAYSRLLARVEEVLATDPGNRGAWALPQGDAFYDAALRWNTSIDLGADAIHRIGLDEVARLEREMDALLAGQGLREGSVAERVAALTRDPKHRYADTDAGRAELLGDVRRILDGLQPHVPRYFGRVPPQELEVRRVPESSEATAPGGYYLAPALDGSRPGTFFINLRDMDSNTRWNLPTLVYHEAEPGHHFQISLAQTLTDLPLLRRTLNPSAFTEGWALYAERLASEMGLYDDNPLGELGRLQAEMFRSVRLVVDTGLHRKRWTPERAIAYMRDKTGMPEAQVRTEVYRYLVQPGQACSYKIGYLKMVELRERAKQRLGDRFDIRAYHDLVLGNGAVPLTVLEKAVDEWIDGQLDQAAAAGLAARPAAAAQSYDNCTGFIDSLPATISTQGVWSATTGSGGCRHQGPGLPGGSGTTVQAPRSTATRSLSLPVPAAGASMVATLA